MSTTSLLARGSLTALLLGAALGAGAQTSPTPTPTPSAGATPSATGTASVDAATLDAAFKQADTNHDGKLSSDELKVIPSLASRFADLDKDKDGSISSAEFAAGVSVKAP
ncbi:MAG TPA: EF-hand domain-containing protein [Albitalea sp.]|jgi:ABC-type transport system substrate-binding protein|nr:EF-hand domain-containing protein [Albitalea sp.]